MAGESTTSMVALRNQHLHVAEEELHSWDWEVVEGEDLYADVESLDSFSVSSRDEEDAQEQEYEGTYADRDDLRSQCDDCKIAVNVLGGDLEVTTSEIHHHNRNYGFDFDSGDVDFDDDMVGEPHDRDVVPLVDPRGFHISGGKVDACNLGNPVLDLGGQSNGLNHDSCDDEDVDDGAIRERQAPIRTMIMFCRSGGYVVPPHYDDEIGDSGIDNHDYDEDVDGGYEIDVDDELVPWGVANRLEKQRMRKLGKRTFAKMNKSKKMAHFYIKRACLHGKYGLGLKTY